MPLELLPCLLNGISTHLLPTTSQSPHLDIHPATRNDLLQTPHDIRIKLHCSVGGSVNGCFRGDVGDKLELGAGVDVLKLSDGVIVKIVPDGILRTLWVLFLLLWGLWLAGGQTVNLPPKPKIQNSSNLVFGPNYLTLLQNLSN